MTADEHAVTDGDALVRFTFCVEHHAVVDHDIVADTDLRGMAERDVGAEEHVAAAGAQQIGDTGGIGAADRGRRPGGWPAS